MWPLVRVEDVSAKTAHPWIYHDGMYYNNILPVYLKQYTLNIILRNNTLNIYYILTFKTLQTQRDEKNLE